MSSANPEGVRPGAPAGPADTRPVLLDAAVTTRCRRRVHLEHDPAAGRASGATQVEGAGAAVLPEPDPGVEMRVADAAEHRALLAARFAELLGGSYRHVPDGPRDERVAATLALATDDAAGAIGAAELPPADGRRGHVELLVRAGGTGRHTGDGWYPVIVVRHRVTDLGSGAMTSPLERPHPSSARPDPERKVRAVTRDTMRLAHLHRMLAAAGLGVPTGPAWAGVVGLDADCVVWTNLAAAPGNEAGRSPLDTYDRRFADRLAVAAAARTGAPALAAPSRITECRRCPWWPVCEADLRRADDVSLVVRGEDALRLRGRGVTTVRSLAAVDPRGGLPEPADGPVEDTGLSTDLREAVALARAWRADVPLVRRVARPDVPRGAVEVDVDMESLGEDGAYLWGVLLSGADVGLEHGYRGFATWDPVPTRDEARSFAAFWTWLAQVRGRAEERGLSFRAYCYNEQAENRWLRGSVERFAGEPGVPGAAEVESFIASPAWVDLFPAVSESFLCPHGKGLKRVAPSAGFGWRDPEAGGENSMRWYRRAVGLDGAEPEPAMRERLLVYNEDDVRATYALRTWMTSDAVLAVPHLDDLRPEPGRPRDAPLGAPEVASAAACAAPRRSG